MPGLRFALVSDVHFGPEVRFEGKLRKLSHHAPALLERFVERMNRDFRPDFVVNLGDCIEDENHGADVERYQQFLKTLAPLEAPLYHIAGNHESYNLSDAELGELWGREGPLYYSLDLHGFHFVMLRSLERKDIAIDVSEEQLDWLRADLGAAVHPAIVFVHHPLCELALDETRWFARQPHLCRVANRRRVREVLEQSGKVRAVFNGHVHWHHLSTVSGIPYVTQQSLIENIDEDAPGRAAAAHAECELGPGRLLVRMRGAEPRQYQFDWVP
jgi:Icc protein